MSKNSVEQLDFEQAITQLETINQKLSQHALPLSEALACYEEGVALTKRCQHLLDTAQLTIDQLTPKNQED